MNERQKYAHSARMIRFMELAKENLGNAILEAHLQHAEVIAEADYDHKMREGFLPTPKKLSERCIGTYPDCVKQKCPVHPWVL
jgi:hypothetical protein